MHGRRKAEHAGRSEAEKAAQQAKVVKYQQLATLALARRREEAAGATAAPSDPAASLQLSGQLLPVNPDVYTLWNHRKDVIQGAALLQAAAPQPKSGEQKPPEEAGTTEEGQAPVLPKAPAAGGGLAFLESELALVAECIQKNPKSYGAWHHRRWLFERAAAAGAGLGGAEGLAPLLDRELLLCTRLLDADERNFHCWNYRRFVAGLHPTRTASDEFAFSTERIYKNFSNYSAIHHRSTYAPGFLREAGVDARDFVRAELEMVQQAIFTEPDDQTAWWYHQYLVALAATAARDQGDPGFLEEVLRGEVAAIRGLLEESSDYRWAVLTLAALFRRLAALLGGGAAGEEAAGMVAESEGLYERLVELDPDHASRYRNILADGRARARAV